MTALGRYPDLCPPRLRLTGDGYIQLENLMQAWGRREGLEDKQVLDAERGTTISPVFFILYITFAAPPSYSVKTGSLGLLQKWQCFLHRPQS